jgi:hypothetical protein
MAVRPLHIGLRHQACCQIGMLDWKTQPAQGIANKMLERQIGNAGVVQDGRPRNKAKYSIAHLSATLTESKQDRDR